MNDSQIREALKLTLISSHAGIPGVLILDELGLRHGSARVDIVVVNGYLHGYELKSDRDTLRRLPRQIRIYNSVLERITLVVGQRHSMKAIHVVPEWWGIKIAEMKKGGEIEFSDAREAQDNPSPDGLAIAKLLWRDEALALLSEIGASDGLRWKPRAAIYARLAEVADVGILRTRVCRQLKQRTNWRFDGRQMLGGG